MSPIQQMLLGVGAVATKTYVDDVFSTYLYKGNGMSQTITNGIDLSGEGGLVWQKTRTNAAGATTDHVLTDTVRGYNKQLITNSNAAQTTDTTTVASFASTGFGLGQSDTTNNHVNTYASWTFRKAPGFFDVVTYTGNGSARTIAHSLGSVPGMVMVKCTSASHDWAVYHRSTKATHFLELNETNAAADNISRWNDTDPTSTHFSVGTSGSVNDNNSTYVAYVFAGGKSTTDKAVDFDGNDFLSFANTSDFVFGTGAYTVEFFINPDTTPTGNIIFSGADTNGFVINMGANSVNINKYSVGDVVSSTSTAPVGQWTHYAFVREGTGSNQTKIYVNGKLDKTGTDANDWTVNANWGLGARNSDGAYGVDGKLSNFRIVKGQAVYKTNFNVPHDPLTTTSQGAYSSNVKLICCNGSTTTASTVTPGTITANGDPAVTTNNSIFDDTSANVFGDAEDQNVIKCGSYVGNASTDGPEINLGWEPQWLLYKSAEGTDNWEIIDMMRGQFFNSSSKFLRANTSGAEFSDNPVAPLSTGFKVKNSGGSNNDNNKTYIYMALRRSDGYVGKPPKLGTDVFAMDTGNTQTTIPNYDSGFPVDFALLKNPGTATSWDVTARLTGTKYIKTDVNTAEANYNDYTFDSNTGWAKDNGPGTMQSWMWKRHAGFTVCTWVGDGTNRIIPHDLSKSPEMIWIKNRGSTNYWIVGHKGLNGGTNPWEKYLRLSTDDSELDDDMFQDLAPTSTHFAIKANDHTNENTQPFIAMLFASVPTISAVGYYDGDATNNINLTSQLDFTPRFFMCKSTTASTGWLVVDKTRDTNMGKRLFLNSDAAETSYDAVFAMSKYLEPNKTGLSVGGEKYIFYAHA